MRLTAHGLLAGLLLCALAACPGEDPGPSTSDPCDDCLPGQTCNRTVDPPVCVTAADVGGDADAGDVGGDTVEDADAGTDLVEEPDVVEDADAEGDADADLVEDQDVRNDPEVSADPDLGGDPDLEVGGDPDVTDTDTDAEVGDTSVDPEVSDDPEVFEDPVIFDELDFSFVPEMDIDQGGHEDEDLDAVGDAEVDDGGDVFGDVDAEVFEPDVADAADLVDSGDSGSLCTLPAVQSLSVALDLPRAANITWVYPADTAEGFVIRQNDGVTEFDVVTLGTPTARAGRVVNLNPGRTYTFKVIAYGTCPGGARVESPETFRVVNVPVPRDIITTDGMVTVGSELVPDSGLGQRHAFLFALTYDAFPPAVVYRNGVQLTNSTMTFAIDEDGAPASITPNGVFQAGPPGTATIDATFAWTGGSLSRSFDVSVVDGTEDGTLQLRLISDTAFTDTVDILVRGPESLLTSERLGVDTDLVLPAGRYELEMTDDDGIFEDVRAVAVVRPGEVTNVTHELVPVDVCQEIPGDNPTPVTLTASDGAELFIPTFALRETTTVCFTALDGLAAPWRSPELVAPLSLAKGYRITGTSSLRLNPDLFVPLDGGVAAFLNDELDGRVRAFNVVRTCPTPACEAPSEPTWLPGPVGVVDVGPPATARLSLSSLDQTITIQACAPFFGTEGACVVRLDGCGLDGDNVDSASSASCGDDVVLAPGTLVLENAELSGSTSELTEAVSYAMGEELSREDFPFCLATPCPGGACNCEAVSSVQSCGYTMSMTLGRLDAALELDETWDIALFVPSSTACAELYGECGGGGDTCPENVESACVATCPWAPAPPP